MPQARKIYPFGVNIDPRNCFKLIILSEGFTAAEERAFQDACTDLVEAIQDTTPFNYLRVAPFWLQAYAHFTPSNNAGPSLNTPASTDRTTFESVLNTTTGQLSFNVDKIVQALDNLQIRDNEGTPLDVSAFLPKGFYPDARMGTVVFIILPPTSSPPTGGEYEHVPNENEYYFAATTMNQLWWQVAIRAIGRRVGLADEFEFDGPEFLEPDAEQKKFMNSAYFNLVHFDTPPTTPLDFTFRWFGLLSSTQQLSPLTVHPHPGPDSTADRSLPSTPASYEYLELWEGGGAYRKKVYRAAKDCLMRRRIGDASLPVREKNVPFCKTCEYFFKTLIE